MEIRPLLLSEANIVHELEHAVAIEVGLEKYVPLSEVAVLNSLNHGLAVGAFDNSLLVGICIGFTELSDSETFRDKLPDWQNILRENMFVRFAYVVLPSARGNGLTKKLLRYCCENAFRNGYQHGIATVAVDNGPSIKILIDSGFRVYFVGPVYGSKVRLVTYKSFDSNLKSQSPSEWVESTDINRQRELLSEGYVGIGAKRNDKHILVGYQLC